MASPSVEILLAVVAQETEALRRWTTCVFFADSMASMFHWMKEEAENSMLPHGRWIARGLDLCEMRALHLRDSVEGEGTVSPGSEDMLRFAALVEEAGGLLLHILQNMKEKPGGVAGKGLGELLPWQSGGILPLTDGFLRSSRPEKMIESLSPESLEGVAFILREALNVSGAAVVEPERLFSLCSLLAGSQPDPGRRERMLLSVIDSHIRHGRMRNALEAASEGAALGPLWDPDLLPV